MLSFLILNLLLSTLICSPTGGLETQIEFKDSELLISVQRSPKLELLPINLHLKNTMFIKRE